MHVTSDVGDANPGDGQCAVAAGGCSLRAAVQERVAGTGAPPDTDAEQWPSLDSD